MLRWDVPHGSSAPRHPYRDTLVVYAAFAVIIVLVAWATGGGVVHAIGLAAVFFVAACGWSWWRWHQRLSRRSGVPRDEEV